MKKDFTNQEIIMIQNQFVEEKKYWESVLSGDLEKSSLAHDFIPENGTTDIFDSSVFELTKNDSEKLVKLSNNSDSNLHVFLFACTAVLFYKYNGIKNALLGTTIDKQDDYQELLNILLPIKLSIDDRLSFKEFLISTKQIVNLSVKNQNFPVSNLSHKLNLYVNGRPSLFDVAIILENIHDQEYLQENHQNIILAFKRTQNQIIGKIEYNARLYHKQTIARIIRNLKIIVNTVTNDPSILISEIDLVTAEDRQFFINFNRTNADYQRDKKVYQLFEETAFRYPDRIAVQDNDKSITYAELNRNANQIADFLFQEGKGQKPLIAVMMDRSIDLISIILGILKSGSPYLAVDAKYPKGRIDYILHDSRTELLFASKNISASLEWKGKSLDLKDFDYANYSQENKNIPVLTSDLAYILYTSGSTGYPKGVMVEHKPLMNYLCWGAKHYTGNEQWAFPLFTSISFDLTITSVFIPLITGNTIIIYNDSNDALLMDKIISDNQIDVIKMTPSHLKLLKEKEITKWKIRKMILGGEKLDGKLVSETVMAVPGLEIYNEYGPTETVVGCMIYKYCPGDEKRTSVPIGVPADNIQIKLLDKDFKYTPVGGIGELYISGECLARGYLNNPEITQSRFIPDPFSEKNLMYRTGDLGRWIEGGILEYVGRIDNQVKINGFRIELKEIEVHMIEIPSVKDAVAVIRNDENNNAQIYAYYISDVDIPDMDMRNTLLKNLPQYMIPSYFILIDKIPLTINGKIDIQALPLHKNKKTRSAQAEPASEHERILLKIWKEVLKDDDIQVEDDFFSLGGDSIKSIQILAKLKEYNLELDIETLFQYPKLKDISRYLRESHTHISQDSVEGEIKLAPIQHWFFENNFPDVHHFNQNVLLLGKSGIEYSRVENALVKLVEHHDILRVIFRRNNVFNISQWNRGVDVKSYEIYEFNFQGRADYFAGIIEQSNIIHRSLNIETGPLLKSAIFHTDNGDYLQVIIHHLLVDGISWRILIEDFISIYKHTSSNMDLKLPLKTSSYKDWSAGIIEYADSQQLKDETGYWKELESLSVESMFSEAESGIYRQSENDRISFELNKEYTHHMLFDVHHAFNTEINDILLTSLGLAFQGWRGLDKVLINLESHGREPISDNIDISRTVGWFTAQYPVILNMEDSAHIETTLKRTKDMLHGVPHKGIGYLILKYLTNPTNKNGLKFSLAPRINFNYLGNLSELDQDDTFIFAEVYAGDLVGEGYKRLYTLDFEGYIKNDKLQIAVNYNRNGLDKSEITRLLDIYSRKLMEVIDMCISKKISEITLSDLSATDIKEDELKSILGDITI